MNSILRKNVKNGQMGDFCRFCFCFLTFSLGLFSNFIIFEILFYFKNISCVLIQYAKLKKKEIGSQPSKFKKTKRFFCSL